MGQDEYPLPVSPVNSLGDCDPVDFFYQSTSDPNFHDSPEICPDYQEDVQNIAVKGRLRRNISFWEYIGASWFIRQTILEGYKIPFYFTPAPATFGNNKSSLQHADFVHKAITDLLAVGSVVECSSPPSVINPLSVSIQSNGKKRLILDLRYPNSFVKKFTIRFEDAKTMLNSFIDHSQNWFYSFDIKSGYHHIDIFPPDQDFLGFSWSFSGVTRYFKFTVLPFGLSTGPYIFTKVMRPLVKYWRSQAYRIVVYLDDGLGVCPTFACCLLEALAVKSDLSRAGFVPNMLKSVWSPVQCLRWLGYFWDLKKKSLSIPSDKIDRLFTSIDDALSHTTMPARQLASVTGSIISNMLVIGNLCKLMTKNLHRALNCRAGWESSVILDLPSRKELIFWRENLLRLNSRPLSEDVRPVTRIAYSDASSLGCAAYLSMDDFPVAHKNWDPLEMSQSSTWRELHCVYFALQSFALRLSYSSVKWFTDNQAVPIIVDSGSTKEELHKLSVDIFYVTRDYNIDLDVEWIPRSLNDKADYLTKIVDCDDWKVKDCYFYALTSYWGQCSVDCFASSKNCKVPRFYSRFYNPYCLGVDSFAFSWAGEFCWLVPPVTLVTRVIRHVCLCKCKGILVIPYWPSAPFWPLLVDSQGSFNLFVIDYLFVENGKDVFLHGSNKNAIFGSENFSTPVLFLLLDGAL